MRAPKLGVKYLEVPRDTRGMGTSGVFIAEPALDREFALSEPVAHDDWVPANLGREKYQRNHVKQTLDQLRRELRPGPGDSGAVQGGQAFSGLVAVANALGGLLEGQAIGADVRVPLEAGANGSGGAGGAGGGGGGTEGGARRSGKLSARVDGQPLLALGSDRQRVAKFPIRVAVPDGERARLSAEARVVVDGGSETPAEAPVGTIAPTMLGWATGLDSSAPVPGATTIADGMMDVLWVWVTQPPDTAVTVLVTIAKEPM